jgi:hypothetical protein
MKSNCRISIVGRCAPSRNHKELSAAVTVSNLMQDSLSVVSIGASPGDNSWDCFEKNEEIQYHCAVLQVVQV